MDPGGERLSYISKPSGLTSVSTDGTTIEGDGTPSDPLVAVGGGGGVTSIIAGTNVTIDPVGGTGDVTINATGGGGGTYSVSKTVFTNAALPPVVSPAQVFPDAGTWFTPTITSADVDYATGDIRFLNAGTYRITMQLSFEKQPDPAQHDVQIDFGLTDAPPNALLYENITFQHFDSNGVGVFSCEFTTVLEATAGQTMQVGYVLGGTPGNTLLYYVGAEAGFIIVERVA